ncbi:hypothetical protein E2C01_004435 [Portunus trituberculatus]|uniref:Uncharacterized protein n=1 Tax=Portunus trituberculatus TaxID=210409 RepID=A0A5B7CQP0_PORTR|nr:hypothetical protein [Portunus trituberculatus]
MTDNRDRQVRQVKKAVRRGRSSPAVDRRWRLSPPPTPLPRSSRGRTPGRLHSTFSNLLVPGSAARW